MLAPILLLALQAAQLPAPDVYNGRRRELVARPPRIDATITVDGSLDEPPWARAAILTGFSSYLPLDDRPATDSTEVRVWYSATAIHFGIRAFERHGPVHATLAARDRIESDDYVQILLDPFDDKRRAFVFAVNPLGAQQDGVRTEGNGGTPSLRNTTFGSAPPANIDLSPDFIFDSKGHVTADGYEVEVRIPLTSLRFQGARTQRWAMQVIRYVQHSGYQQTWTPARKGSASFLNQSGELDGLTDLSGDVVVETNPVVTTRVSGAPRIVGTTIGDSAWHYDTHPEVGANVRVRLRPNLTFNGTVKPDFSQVEADAAQIPGDSRFSLFFPEKRPFFVDGIEQLDAPDYLIYTRRIVQPAGAGRLSGKIGRTNLAVVGAVDDAAASTDGTRHPVFALARFRRDLFATSTAGLTFTDREEGHDFNRVGALDMRVIVAKYYTFSGAVAASTTRLSDTTRTAPLFDLSANRTGYRFGFLYSLNGVAPDFAAQSGYVPRSDYVHGSFYNRVTFYPTHSWLESWVVRQGLDGTWTWDDFKRGREVLETKVQLENVFTIRGGWSVSLTPVHETFRFDANRYAGYRIDRTPSAQTPDTGAFTPGPRTGTYVLLTKISTPQFQQWSARFSSILGRDVDFFETAATRHGEFSADVDFRPSQQLRLTTSFLYSHYVRARDGTTFSNAAVPRAKLEYQLSRALFVRFVGQYDGRHRDALRDPRTGLPIYILDDDSLSRASLATTRDFRLDWLLSYVPSPGTVVYAGYGSSLTEADAFRFRGMRRVQDGLFIKLSYIVRR